jgi:hypothetical protein
MGMAQGRLGRSGKLARPPTGISGTFAGRHFHPKRERGPPPAEGHTDILSVRSEIS